MADPATPAVDGGSEATPAQTVERTYTDTDMAKLRQSYEHKIAKASDTASQTAQAAFLADLGVDSIDDLRDTLEAAKAQQGTATQAEMDAKKAAREAKNLAKSLEEAQARIADYDQRDKAAKSKDAIHSAAKAAHAYEDDVWAHLRDRVIVDDTGTVLGVNGEAVEELVKALVGERKNLLRPTPGVGAGSLPANNGESPADMRDPQVRLAALRAAGFIPS